MHPDQIVIDSKYDLRSIDLVETVRSVVESSKMVPSISQHVNVMFSPTKSLYFPKQIVFVPPSVSHHHRMLSPTRDEEKHGLEVTLL